MNSISYPAPADTGIGRVRVSAQVKREQRAERLRWLYVPALAMICFGYPLTTVWLLKAGMPTSIFNIGINLVIASCFALSLASSLTIRRKIPLDFIPLYAFFFFYGMRLLWDVLALGIILPGGSVFETLSYFFVLTFMPSIAIGLAFDKKDVPDLHKWMFWILALSNISIIIYVLTDGEVVDDSLLSTRFQVEGEAAGTSVLNPIVISLMGAMLALFVIGRLAAFKTISLMGQFWHLALFAIGIMNLLLGGSRGPILNFAIGLMFVAASLFMSMLGKGHLRIGPRVAMYMVLAVGGLLYLSTSDIVDVAAFDRINAMFDGGTDRKVEERDYLFAAAWQQFVDSPVYGTSYAVMDGLTFPHNSFLEAVSSVGFFGGIAYIFSFWMFLRGVWSSLFGYAWPHAYSIALTAVALMALSMTSGSVGKAPNIWCMMALMMCISSIGIGRRTNEQESRRLNPTGVRSN